VSREPSPKNSNPMTTNQAPEQTAAAVIVGSTALLGSVFSVGIMGAKTWWVVNDHKGQMVTLERIEWCKDMVKHLGMMSRTGYTMRRKLHGGAPYCRERGSFTACPTISVLPNAKAEPDAQTL